MHPIWTLAQTLTGRRLRVKQPVADRVIYLTFDDGPNPQVTPALLEVLRSHGARATFFLLGGHAQAHPDIARRIVAEGHALGNHSMTHPDFRTLSPAAQRREVQAADQALAPFDQQVRHVFRPPKGAATLWTIFNAILRDQPVVLWTFDSEDYRLRGQDLVARLARYQPASGDIVLFHDDMPSTVEALAQLLPRWQAAGFRFGTV